MLIFCCLRIIYILQFKQGKYATKLGDQTCKFEEQINGIIC